MTKRCAVDTIVPVMQQVSNPIQTLLKQRNTSLRRLAAEVGISPSTLSRWASGKQTPSTQCCRKLAVSLSLPVEEVLTWAGHLTPQRNDVSTGSTDYRTYAQLKYPAELQEDMIAMIEDLIPECYPSPNIGKETI